MLKESSVWAKTCFAQQGDSWEVVVVSLWRKQVGGSLGDDTGRAFDA